MGRVVRGGSWINSNSRNLRVSYRNGNDAGNRNDNLGFRVVVSRRSQVPPSARMSTLGSGPRRRVPGGSRSSPRGPTTSRAVRSRRAVGPSVRTAHSSLNAISRKTVRTDRHAREPLGRSR
ncbi:MAG: SUMF1/EgtB/PvdO family nonheme iron enzyme [Acidobacteriota bacterium]